MQLVTFIEAQSGSYVNHKYDETTGAYLGGHPLSDAYPQNYGFIPGTCGEDGDCVDCFVLSNAPLRRGQSYNCELIGLLEMWENDEMDHKILLSHRHNAACTEREIAKIVDFERRVFGGQPGIRVTVGRVESAQVAWRYVEDRLVDRASVKE